jgi:hypothetical protein
MEEGKSNGEDTSAGTTEGSDGAGPTKGSDAETIECCKSSKRIGSGRSTNIEIVGLGGTILCADL